MGIYIVLLYPFLARLVNEQIVKKRDLKPKGRMV